MKTIDLAGTWQMTNLNTGKIFDACLPGSNIGALIKCGHIPDLFSLNLDESENNIFLHNFSFSSTFTMSAEELKMPQIHLCAGGFDTLCTCKINGQTAFSSRNAFKKIDENIKEFVHLGENEIELIFASAVKFIKEKHKQQPIVKNFNGIDGIMYIRKPACHFGWDWGPCVPYCGVEGYINICCFKKRIENVSIRQNTTKEKSTIQITADSGEKFKLYSPNGRLIAENENGLFEVTDPELWYTKEMSPKPAQPLYKIEISNSEHNVSRKIGLRSVKLDTSKDEHGSNFCFVLNDHKIFAKGANLIPFASFPEDAKKGSAEYYVNLALKSNFNILRIWGGGSFANEELLNLCDEKGILVWQDLLFACQMYPLYDDEFVANVKEEIKENVQRLAMHPSLCLLCGNNEIEVMYSYLPKTSKLVKAYKEFFYSTVPGLINSITDTSYIPSSPLGESAFCKNASDNVGDTHMWNVWHGLKKLDYYATRYTRFLSEFGLESLPSMKAIKTFAQSKDFSLKSKAFLNRQKCTGGNEKMMFYLTSLFDFPKNFENLPYLTGIVQAECVKNATNHFRQNKGRCNGSVFWQFNDVWNCPSWSSVDFEGVPKALQYRAKDFFAPIGFSIKKEKKRAVIFAHNDTLQSVTVALKIKMINPDFEKSCSVEIPAESVKIVDEIHVNSKSILQLIFNSQTITEYFSPFCKMKLKKANIKTNIEGNKLTVTSDKLAYNVFIESEQIPSDNYFSLLPNESRTIYFNKKPDKFTVHCANNMEFERNKLKKFFFRFTYRLKPMNIANYFYYSMQ